MKQYVRDSKMLLAAGVLICSALSTGCLPHGIFSGVGAEKIKIQTHNAKTSDGWSLQVDHYQPTTPDPSSNPVVLCHGLSYNSHFWDLSKEISLARYLAQQGYDVWSVSLRGAGFSDQPMANIMRKISVGALDPGFLLTAQNRNLDKAIFSEYSVDDHINYDVPAVIELVKQKTQAKKVHWIGHSMGGIIMFAYLATHPESAQDVDSFVAVSVPMTMFHPLNKAMQMQVDNVEALKAGNVVLSTTPDSLVARILGKWVPPTTSETLFLNRDNVTDGTLRFLALWAQEGISTGQLTQLLDLAAEEEFYSLDKKINYTALLHKVTTPTFFLVGQLDNMATVGDVKYVHREVSSQQKKFKLFGRINGYKANYGHDDIIIGQHAKEEVFPEILKWLDGRK